MSVYADHPPRLEPFENYADPLWFVTFCTAGRRPLLARESLHCAFRELCDRMARQGVAVGRYVIMPDHVHMFLRLNPEYRLGRTVGFLKKSLSKSLDEGGDVRPHWQPGFFDHMLRHDESYAQKWAYVCNNPVRAGLVEASSEWPYQGEVVSIDGV